MNAIQKASFAASALAITIIGAALAAAPINFARPVPVAAHGQCSTPSLQLTLSRHVTCAGVGSGSGLIALNSR